MESLLQQRGIFPHAPRCAELGKEVDWIWKKSLQSSTCLLGSLPVAGPRTVWWWRQERLTKRALECDALFSFYLETCCPTGFVRTGLTDPFLEFEDCHAWPFECSRVQVVSPENFF